MNLKFLLCFILLSQNLVNLNSTYDYTNYNAISTNTELSEQTLLSTTADQSVVYITQSGISIVNSKINKESGDSSNIENSEFYGVNAAVLVNGGELTMTGGTVTTAAQGANSLCATNGGKVSITDTEIISTAQSSARGLHATYGGEITANNVKISSTGGSCANLATDRGEGTVTCTGCTLSTAGAGSPLIYSTGDITVSGTTGTSTGAQAVVVEGKNSASVLDSSNLNCYGLPNAENNIDICGVMLYQSMSGDADSGTSTFTCKESTITIDEESSVYGSAPMFFITNTDAVINLESCTLTYGSNIFLSAAGTSKWGTSGSNGGVVTLNLKNQNVVGNFVIDANSGITINLENSSINGKINEAKTGAKVAIVLDENSSITLTGNSYYTSLQNAKADGTNIIKGEYSFEEYSENTISRPSSGQGGSNNQPTPPSGSNNQPTPPSGSNNPPTPPSGSNNPPTPPSGSNNPPTPPSGSNNPPTPPSGSNTKSTQSNDDADDNDEDEEDGAMKFSCSILLNLCLILSLIL